MKPFCIKIPFSIGVRGGQEMSYHFTGFHWGTSGMSNVSIV